MAAFVLALLIGGSWNTSAAEAGVEVRIVDLGGYCVRVQSAALDARAPGTPLVIFESGVAQSSDAWRSILSRAGRFAPALSYDRAGLGQSEWDGTDPTVEHMNFRLRRLLDQLGAEPPYILVGHSLGGMLVHQFAARWPSEVSGLVLVDPAPLLTEARSFRRGGDHSPELR
ncbi:MAG TPA: alpha/beta fold hydrolase [Thermoanaerobaculia bacterium]|nr:alpha/beta fold hydrolase [Thermoanaerobaculia bacterium]